MKYNFCTLFDSYYLSRGINLYNSLVEYCNDFHLYIFAFDDNSYELLMKMNLKNATIISLFDFENKDLLSVKRNRTIAEYCWTCSASTITYSIEKYNLNHCTYLDADMMFFSDPEVIFKEIGEASVAITSHNFSDDLITEQVYGNYCVQFVYFKNDKDGIETLNWWKQSCIDWCYAILEENRYGDQKYLNFFKEKFSNVIDINNIGVGVAPWNINRFQLVKEDNKIRIKDKYSNNLESYLVFYHYQGLKFIEHDSYIESIASNINIPNSILELIYTPYIEKIYILNKELKDEKSVFKKIKYKSSSLTSFLRFFKKNIKKSKYLTTIFFRFKVFKYKRHKNIG
jgi:hypothetical protein